MAIAESCESSIRAAWDRGDFDISMTLAVERYANELYGFLRGLGRDDSLAEEAFSATLERIWRALPRFRWESSFRVWAYRIARNELLRVALAARRARRSVPLESVPAIAHIVEACATIPPHRREDAHDRFAAARAQLTPDELFLLDLRIGHRMPWAQIAHALGTTSSSDVAAIRKRFERLKAKLRRLVHATDARRSRDASPIDLRAG
jgi:RNA polymerase sigma-70 factor (ECF subfamily)